MGEFLLNKYGSQMILDVFPLALPGALLIRSKRFADKRGYFAETYVQRDYFAAGINNVFIQDNEFIFCHARNFARPAFSKGSVRAGETGSSAARKNI